MSFELVDNLFQVVVLFGAAVAAAILSIRRKERGCLILAFGYACFAMGTLFYVLYLTIMGTVPQVFYVSEISWLAAYLFFLSLQIVRTEELPMGFQWPAALCALVLGVSVLVIRIFGPSWLVCVPFALTVGGNAYLSGCHLREKPDVRWLDACMLAALTLQVALYPVSGTMTQFTHFNLYFAVDLTLTTSLVALLPLRWKEVTMG